MPYITKGSRSYVCLNLEGVDVGFVKSVDGGGVTAEVISEAAGRDYFAKKHIGPTKYEDVTMQIGLSMNKAIYDWITASWKMDYQHKNGSILTCDEGLRVTSERQFFNALITEMTIPAMDSSSKDPASIALKFRPESTRLNTAPSRNVGLRIEQEAVWLPSNFQLNISGLDCTKVNKIDAFTIKRGESAGFQVDFPNLEISLAESNAQTWIDWHGDFVIKGHNQAANEKMGSLIFLTSNRGVPSLGGTPLGGINFFNLGIFRLSQDYTDAASDGIKHVTAGLYCDRMEFIYGSKPEVPTLPGDTSGREPSVLGSPHSVAATQTGISDLRLIPSVRPHP